MYINSINKEGFRIQLQKSRKELGKPGEIKSRHLCRFMAKPAQDKNRSRSYVMPVAARSGSGLYNCKQFLQASGLRHSK